jgi:hypothetical protein
MRGNGPEGPQSSEGRSSCSGCDLGKRFIEFTFYVDARLRNPDGGYEQDRK